MQLMDRGGALASRPAPNPTVSPGYCNNDLTQSTLPTVSDPDCINSLLAEGVNLIAAAGLTPNKAVTNQWLTAIQALIAAGGGNVNGQVELQYTSATQITLVPRGGNQIRIAGTNYSIPAAGVALSNAGLAASTLYYVYLYNNSGTLTLQASTTGHSSDTAAGNIGVEIKTGDNTHSLVGMIETNGAAQFQAQGIGVLSWFNRRAIPLSATIASVNFTSGTLAEATTAARVSFLTWGEEGVTGVVDGTGNDNTAGAALGFQGAVDGTLDGTYASFDIAGAGYFGVYSSSVNGFFAEGSHYLTVFAAITGGGGSAQIVQGSTRVMVRG